MEKTTKPCGRGGLGGHGERILFLDDEPDLVTTTRLILQRYGYEVSAFGHPTDALREFQRHPDQFDLVLTDMSMPDMSGVEFARRILDLRADIPIILATGYSEELSPDKVAKMGFCEMIAKPTPPRQVVEIIGRTLKYRGWPASDTPLPHPPFLPHQSP
jgi:two-component system, cell cycle sensor histidine kinase and response regulator CckA